MNNLSKRTIYKLSSHIGILLFAIVAIVWLLKFNRYHVIGYMEEFQLFRSDLYYFHDYIILPGGLIEYLGSFFTQFYYYPVLGAVIISTSIALVYILFMTISRRNGDVDRFFLFPFAIPILLLMSCVNINFKLSFILGICFVLFAFWIYTFTRGKLRYIAATLLYLICYFVAGGNAILFVSLVVISELFAQERSFLYLLALIILAVFTPYLAYMFIYTATLPDSYYSLTPFNLGISLPTYIIAWCCIPAIYLLWRCIYSRFVGETLHVWKVLVPSYTLMLVMTIWGIKSVTDNYTETIARMSYAVEHANWEEVLKLNIDNDSDILGTYFTNLALLETGDILDNMFEHRQVGPSGLFLDWNIDCFTTAYVGEMYYRLGIIPEAEHCAFESLVTNPNEHGSKALRRLVYTTMLRGDVKGFEKYVSLFEKSPVYKTWAKKQREYFAMSQQDSTFVIPNTPQPVHSRDFYINHDMPEYNLRRVLRDNHDNQKAFECLIASIVLTKDVKRVIDYMDAFYANFSYSSMPRVYEEAVLIYRYAMPGGENILERYPVSKKTIADFTAFSKDMSALPSKNVATKEFKAKHGQTFWYYYTYIDPMPRMMTQAPVGR